MKCPEQEQQQIKYLLGPSAIGHRQKEAGNGLIFYLLYATWHCLFYQVEYKCKPK